MFKLIPLLTVITITIGCASGNCRQLEEAEKAKHPQKSALPTGPERADRIKIYKYDGSLQCGMGKALSVEEMKKQLKNITVYAAENKPDNLMHIQQCGSPTGTANVYQIDRKDFKAARDKGFREWTFE